MNITLRPEQERLIAEAVRSGAFHSPDEVIEQALDMFHSREEWLEANRRAIDASIQRGIDELDRGEGIAEDQVGATLEKLKAQPE